MPMRIVQKKRRTRGRRPGTMRARPTWRRFARSMTSREEWTNCCCGGPRRNNAGPREDRQMIGRIAVFTYGVLSYAIFFVTFLVMIAFVGNVVLPRTIDGDTTVNFPVALLINTG